MRIRARTTTTTIPAGQWLLKWNSPNPPGVWSTQTTTNYSAFTFDGLVETIEDELPNRRRSGYVKHTKVRTDMASGSPSWETRGYLWVNPTTKVAWYRNEYSDYCVTRHFVGNNWNGWLTVSLSIPQFNWSQASYDAMSAMRPTLESGLLTPNFIAELAEMGVLSKQAASRYFERRDKALQRALERAKRPKRKVGIGWFPNIPITSGVYGFKRRYRDTAKAIYKGFASLGKHTLRSLERIMGYAAWANLAYQFAVRPAISDAKKIANLLEGWRSLVSDLIRQAGVLQRRHYGRPVDLFTLPAATTRASYTHQNMATTVVSRHEFISRPKYHATMLFTYDAVALQGLLGKLDGLIHAFGVNRVASIVWEAIPFSFVVDWFVNVGDMLANLEDRLLDPLPVIIHDFSHSLKYEYQTRLEFTHAHIRTDLGWRKTSFYERRRDTPSLWDSLSVHSPNLNQAGLGLSLIYLKMDGINKRKR